MVRPVDTMKSIAFWMARDGCCATLDSVSVYHLLVLKETPPAQGGIQILGTTSVQCEATLLLTQQHTRTGSLNVGASLEGCFKQVSFFCVVAWKSSLASHVGQREGQQHLSHGLMRGLRRGETIVPKIRGGLAVPHAW